MTTRYNLCVPVTYKDDQGSDTTSFTKVGVMFENTRRETGEVFFSLKLDFPVAVTNLVAFTPKTRSEEG